MLFEHSIRKSEEPPPLFEISSTSPSALCVIARDSRSQRQQGCNIATAIVAAIATSEKRLLPINASTDIKAMCDSTPVPSFGQSRPTLCQFTNANIPAASVNSRAPVVTRKIGRRVPP
jgi:hypothetical protein